MMRRRLALFTVILFSALNGSTNGFQSRMVRVPRTTAANVAHHQQQLAILRAVVPLSENDTSFPSSSWVPLNGKVQDSAAAAVQDSAVAVAVAVASPSFPVEKNKIAVILNMNARGVTESTAEIVRKALLSDKNNNNGRVFVTRSSQEAMEAATEIISDSSYKLVIPVGGDGTLTTVINSLVKAIQQQQQEQQPSGNVICVSQAIQQMPLLAYIPLGTGNGVGPVVGCKLKRRFRKRRQNEELEALFTALQKASDSLTNNNAGVDTSTDTCSIVQLPIMEVTVNDDKKKADNILCFFAGVGFDSLMLNDYKELQSWSRQTGILTRFLSSVKGYCVALVVKTLPAAILKDRHNIHVKVTCPKPDEALWIDHRRGDFVQKVTNKTLYEGKTGILAAGTAPFYGGGLRLFPFARMTLDKMHLRLGRIHPATGFFNIPSIFAGSYRDKSDRFGVLDFMLTDVDVQVMTPNGSEYEKGFPFQHSGESVGLVERFRIRVIKEPVKFVCLRRQR